ncbi:MAG: hypothetical protein PHR81_11530, partial [Bacteroidales bacterium]|nr:hypothetical protein [Bacteroidales bacterium]
MKKNSYFLTIIFCIAFILARSLSLAQHNTCQDSTIHDAVDYFTDNYLRAEDFIYKPNIKTVLFYR